MADNKNLEKKEVAKKDKKDGIGKKISKFFREYRSELKKISWPTFPEVIKNSLVTVAVVVMVGAFIWIVDSVLTLGRDALLSIDTNTTVSDTADSETNLRDQYGIKVEYMSTSDIFSGSDMSEASISDMYPDDSYYVVTVDGTVLDSSVTSNSDVAEATADSYASTMQSIAEALSTASTTESSTAASPTDASTSDASSTDAE